MRYRHRNSQKRIYEEGAEYFVTTVTYDRYPYFANAILAELFVRDLWFAKELKQFDLFGYTVLPDHVHVLFQPGGTADYSEIMGSLKRNVSRDINDIIGNKSLIRGLHVGDDSNRRLRMNYEQTRHDHPHVTFKAFSSHFHAVENIRKKYHEILGMRQMFHAFRWQKSFRDHIIRDENDYLNHLDYIYNNAVKHGLKSDTEQYPWMWIVGMNIPFAPD